MANVDNDDIVKHNWNDMCVHFPFNYDEKLANRYGENWRIPQNSKGPKPRKHVI